MGYRKKFKILVAVFLSLGFFSNSALAEVCFCGKYCLHGLQPEANPKANSLFHVRCLDNLCKSCDLEEAQTPKATKFKTQAFNLKILDTPFIPFALFNYSSAYHILINFDSFYIFGAISSSPIYLQKHSLLC